MRHRLRLQPRQRKVRHPQLLPLRTTASDAPAKNAEVASTGVEKPGKKEKIRFGQAPRETLPAAPTKTEDAGANAEAGGTQVATGNVPQNMQVVGPDGSAENQPVEAKPEKTRYSARAKEPKQKKAKDKSDPFAPSPELRMNWPRARNSQPLWA